MSEELNFVGRYTHAQTRTYKQPVIKFDLKYHRVTISQKAADILGVKEGDGIIFAFGKDNKVFVRKHNDEDAYILRRKNAYSFTFSAKTLIKSLIKAINRAETDKSPFIFNMKKPDTNGLHQLVSVDFI